MSEVPVQKIGNVNLSDHLDTMRTSIVSHDFDKIEEILSTFWSQVPSGDRGALAHADALLATKMLYRAFYENMIQSMIPDVFRPMTHATTKNIRWFAKQSERWTRSALEGYPEPFVSMQIDLVIAFAQKIRRYTGLNHLVQAARAVLSNPQHIQQMQVDYSKVDFAAAEDQLIQTCEGCPREVISRHETKFREFHQSNSCKIMEWASWMQGIVAESMGVCDNDMAYEERGSNLLLRWSFMSSMVIRDLTLRSAASFGPFHLMRLLCDEYMYFLVEAALQRREFVPFVHEAEPVDATATASEDVDMEKSGPAAASSASSTVTNAPPLQSVDTTAASVGTTSAGAGTTAVVPPGTTVPPPTNDVTSSATTASAAPNAAANGATLKRPRED